MFINKIKNNNLTFNSKCIGPTRQKEITYHLSRNMQKKTPLLKDFYQLNIDFICTKITKKDYLRRMFGLSEAIYNSKETLNMVEKHLIDSFRLFFDMYGCNQNLTTKSNIIEGIEWLLKV